MLEALSSKATPFAARSSRRTDNPVRRKVGQTFLSVNSGCGRHECLPHRPRDGHDFPSSIQLPAGRGNASVFFTFISLVRRIATLATSRSHGPRHFVAACPLFLSRIKWICLPPIIDDSLSNGRQALRSAAGRKPVILREPQRPKDLAYFAARFLASLGMTSAFLIL